MANGKSKASTRKRSAQPAPAEPNNGAALSRQVSAPANCDALDKQLIELLLKNVRISNRQLAAQTGITEWTVANRLRRLREDNLLAATLVLDWRLAGYNISAVVLVQTEGHVAGNLADKLRGRPDLQSVCCTLGNANLILHALAGDLTELRKISDEIGALKGVAAIEMLPVVDYHRFIYDRAPLPLPSWNPDELIIDSATPDALDRQLMSCLIEDAHQSNREIARQLGVSENAIRHRIRRLQDSQLARVIAVVDPFALGDVVISYFALSCRGSNRGEIATKLSRREDVPALLSCLGRYDIVGLIMAESLNGLMQALDGIHALKGVDTLTHFPITSTPLNRYHLTRLGS